MLKLTHSNVEMKKKSGGNTPGPPLQGEGREEEFGRGSKWEGMGKGEGRKGEGGEGKGGGKVQLGDDLPPQ